MSSSIEAEAVQLNCNRSKLDGQEIRVSYGMPCRPGACILHPRHNNGTHVTWNNKVVPHKIVGPYCNGAPALPTGVMLNNEPMVSYDTLVVIDMYCIYPIDIIHRVCYHTYWPTSFILPFCAVHLCI